MSQSEIRPVHFLLAGLVIAGPVFVVLILLALFGKLDLGGLLSLGLLVLLLTTAMLILAWRDSRRLALYIDQLSDHVGEAQAPRPPEGGSAATTALLAGIGRLHQNWAALFEAREKSLAGKDAVLESLHDPLLLIDEQRRVAYANAAARALFGERLLQRDLAVSLRSPALLAAVDEALGGQQSRSVEISLPMPVERILEARVKRLADGPGAQIGKLILSLHDVTAAKRAEQMRGDFVANASHELRTPLASLLGFVETLRGPAKDDAEARERFLAIMNDQAARMSRLVNDLLSLSRIEMDEHTAPTGTADMDRIVRTVATMLELKAAQRKITLRIEAPAQLPPVQGDEDQLAQVVQNLVDNAIKYAREQTEVTITLDVTAAETGDLRTRAPRTMRIAVRDRGEGIAKGHLPRLTERFYRVDAARSRALGGTGLGLAIVKHIVNRHRGRLLIESDVGQGSTFTLVLPIAESAAGRPPTGKDLAGNVA